MRLNGEIEWFLHEAEWGSCTRLSKAASDRRLSVCLCKNVVYNWIDIFGAETSCEEIENQVKCYKRRKPTTERVSRALFRSVFDCIEWGSIPAIRGNPPHPLTPIIIMVFAFFMF